MLQKDKEILQKKIEQGKHELQNQKQEIEKHKQEIENQYKKDFEIRYQHEGISNCSEIIAANRKDMNILSQRLITELVTYTGTQAGMVYLVDDIESAESRMYSSGAYCYYSDIDETKKFSPSEGYIGICYRKKKTIQVDNLPDGYISLSSGLGNTPLRHCLFIPIINDKVCLGVFEIASSEAIENFKIEFISKLAESFASVIAVHKANQRSEKMLEENRLQAQELIAQEEELRQNLEEMQATQEELKRQINSSKKCDVN